MLAKKNKDESKIKTLLDRFIEIEDLRTKEDRIFEDKLKKLRDEASKEIKLNEKHQPKSEVIGSKEWNLSSKPNKQSIYSHYASKYNIPYSNGKVKKTIEELVRDIHAYEMKHRDKIVKGKIIDPVTGTYGLYIN